MVVRKSERTGWYLALQRLFDFPRLSFAPTSLQFRRSLIRGFNDEASSAIRRRSSGNSFLEARSHPTGVLLPPLAGYLTARGSEDRRSTSGHTVSSARREVHAQPFTQFVENQRLGPVQVRRLPRQLLSGTAPPGRTPEKNQKPVRFAASSSTNWGQTPTGGSRFSHWLSSAGSPNFQQSFAPAATLRSADCEGGSESTMQSVNDSRMPASKWRPLDDPAGHDNKRANKDGRSENGAKTVVSTLHIDGSSLGRWALQHLERSLGKPTSGMTGIDPRATPPRSRVSPF